MTRLLPIPGAVADGDDVDEATVFEIEDAIAVLLSKPGTAKGRLQRAVLAVLLEHADDGGLPTPGTVATGARGRLQ